MKILRTLPFVVVAGLIIFWSASGTMPMLISIAAFVLPMIAWAVSIFGYVGLPAPLGLSDPPEVPGQQQRRLLIVAASLAAIVSTAFLHWPMRVSFWLSRPALDRIAQQASQGKVLRPQNVGLFSIERIEPNPDGTVLLYLDYDPGESTMLVRKTRGKGASRTEIGLIELDNAWHLYGSM